MKKKKNREGLTIKVKTARGRKSSSTRWLQRQLNDPFVDKAKRDGYRSRAVYKLMEIQEKFKIIDKQSVVVDLGAAPGSWSQIITKYSNNTIIAMDINDFDTIANVEKVIGDINEDETLEEMYEILGDKKVDVVLSDMASPAIGHQYTDHLRIIHLCEVALDFALKTLEKGGNFAAKLFHGGGTDELVADLKKHFMKVKFFKPQASRKDSNEIYVVALSRK